MLYEDRPKVLEGSTTEIVTGCGDMYVTINKYDGKPVEVFSQIGKAGGCINCQTQSTSRLIALCLRLEATPEVIIKQLAGISCHKANGNALSCSDALAQVLKEFVAGPEGVE